LKSKWCRGGEGKKTAFKLRLRRERVRKRGAVCGDVEEERLEKGESGGEDTEEQGKEKRKKRNNTFVRQPSIKHSPLLHRRTDERTSQYLALWFLHPM
jgi:hypothetical protein